MLAHVLFGVVALGGPQQPVTLARVFKPGERRAYDVRSHLQMETRGEDVETFMPSDFDLNYSFTLEVVQLKADGIAVVRYRRPTMTMIEGETFNSPPRPTTEKINLDFLLTVSPINEILETKDQRKPAPKKRAAWMTSQEQDPVAGGMLYFIQDLRRLALFAGSFDSALDFSPKLPLAPVQVGETWKRTVGYQPQKLGGAGGKTAVQRLDYTFTYGGLVGSGSKRFHRVTAELVHNGDLADWARQYGNEEDEAEGPRLTKLPVELKATVEFDLDVATGHTVAARARSEGGFRVFLSTSPGQAAFEQRFKGRTTLTLKSLTPAGAKPSVAKKKPL